MKLHLPYTVSWAFYLSEWAICLLMLCIVPLRRSPAAAKGWLLLIFFEPWLGILTYWFIGRPSLSRRWLAKDAQFRTEFEPVLQDLWTRPANETSIVPPEFRQAVTLTRNLGLLPIVGGNGADILAGHRAFIDRLIQDIDEARLHVHLMFYLFADDSTGREVVAALVRAERRGVRCRILIDALGSRAHWRKLKKAFAGTGVGLERMLPAYFIPWNGTRFDLRNHRKIVVIDGDVGFVGSQNIVNAEYRDGISYEELMVRVTGPVVRELQWVFAQSWFVETDERLPRANFSPADSSGGMFVQALPSGPSFPVRNIHRLTVALIHSARKRVTMVTPYFIPDEALLQAMETAVLSGARVDLIVSEKADQFLVGAAQRSYYAELLQSGVSIHLYSGKFLHAKHMTVDDEISIVGSSNMDTRSYVLNAEISLVFFDAEFSRKMRREESRYLDSSRPLTLEDWDRRPLAARTAQNIARLLSPLL